MQPELNGSILGANYTYPVEGTPLIPPTYVTIYFLCYLLAVGAVYLYFYLRRRPVLLWHKFRLLVIIALVLKVSVVAGGSLLAAYWLIPPPRINITTPEQQSTSFSSTNKIEIYFDRPVNRRLLEKSIYPDVPGRWVFENSLYTTHLYRKLVFYPTYSLRPNTPYTVKLAKIRNLVGVFEPYEDQFTFTTQPSPRVETVSPLSGQNEIDPGSTITVKLTTPNYSISEFDFLINPKVEFDQSLDTTHTIYTLTPKAPLRQATTYHLMIQKSDVILNLEEGSIVERDPVTEEYDGTFTTKQTPQAGSFEPLLTADVQVSAMSPRDGWTAVNIHSPVKVTFDQEVDHLSAEQRFSITPHIDGSFVWTHTTMTFVPDQPFTSDSSYAVVVETGVTSSTGRVSQNIFKSVFATQNATTKLAVPVHLQQYTLSCEIAALRMALNFRDANVVEDDLIPLVGFDTTAHNGDVWGNPYTAFVGNIKGTQMKDGYGVYWGPIAKAARNYRDAQDFQGWNIEQLTQAIESNNPVVIWVYSHHGTKTSWKTPDGTDIYAVRDEHAVVAVGFVGPAVNPTQIIVNDPLIGQAYWSRATFDHKWDIFGRSGVVVY